VKRVAIVQSNYIPWRGYFDLIASVDEFVLYDDAQYTKRDWRNRNTIKTPQGLLWLTVPVRSKGRFDQRVCETEIDGSDWQAAHWKSILQHYARARHIADLRAALAPVFEGSPHALLSGLNRALIESVCGALGITTRLSTSAGRPLPDGRTAKLVELCRRAGAATYVSGPAARAYLDESEFASAGISVEWFGYEGYPEYPQLWGAFEPRVSVVDLIANCGPRAPEYMKYVPRA
jgi:hypothetical protein